MFQAQFDQVRHDLRNLRREHEACKEEMQALRDCLESAGLLRPGQLAARLHRRMFDNVLRRNSGQWHTLLTDVVHAPGVLHPILRAAGLPAIKQVACCSQALRNSAAVSHRYAAMPAQLYLFGGCSTENDRLATAMRFHVDRQEWEDLPAMSCARDVLAATAVGSHLFAIGGTNGQSACADFECFDTEANKWITLPPMPTPRGGHGAAHIDDKIYVIGGTDGVKTLAIVECFDMKQMQWTTSPPLLTVRRGLCVVAAQRCLYALGGSNGNETLAMVERFDVDNGYAWENVSMMPTPRRAAAAAVFRGHIFVVGGNDPQGEPLTMFESYNLDNGTWISHSPMPAPLRGLALLATDGRLYALGGADGDVTHNSVVTFDPEIGKWQSCPAMPTRRAYCGAAVVQVAQVLGLTIGPATAAQIRQANYQQMESVRDQQKHW